MSRLLASVLALAATSACYDPVHQDGVAALGDEAPGVPPGPFHRPGQPCLTCHAGDGPSDAVFSIAGTVFEVRSGSTPEDAATVTIVDATGASRSVYTNAAGNFFVRASDWRPTFPARVSVQAGDVVRNMTTLIGRDGGCGTCHRDGGDRTYMPGVFVRDK